MSKNTQTILIILAVVLVIVVGYSMMTQPDDRNPVQRVGDAVEELPNTGEAAEELENQSPADQAADAIDDAVDEMQAPAE